MRQVLLILFAALLAAFAFTTAADAVTYYVSHSGSNSNSGTQSAPFQTIQKGVTSMAGGDTLYIRKGVYHEAFGQPWGEDPPSGASWSSATLIAGYPGESVTLANRGIAFSATALVSYVIFDNLIIDNGSLHFGVQTHHVRFSNGEVRNCPGICVTGAGSYNEVIGSKIHERDTSDPTQLQSYCFYVAGVGNIYDGNEVYNCGGYGFHLYSSGSNSTADNIIRNNFIHDNGFNTFYADGSPQKSSGIIMSTGPRNKAYNNIIYNNWRAVDISYRCHDCELYNNTIINNPNGGVGLSDDSNNVLIKNNIVYNNGGGIIDRGNNSTGAIISNNFHIPSVLVVTP